MGRKEFEIKTINGKKNYCQSKKVFKKKEITVEFFAVNYQIEGKMYLLEKFKRFCLIKPNYSKL